MLYTIIIFVLILYAYTDFQFDIFCSQCLCVENEINELNCFYMFEPKKNPNVIYKLHGKLWGDDIINSLICIFISTVQETFRLKLRK